MKQFFAGVVYVVAYLILTAIVEADARLRRRARQEVEL